jgi:hypothetical protein
VTSSRPRHTCSPRARTRDRATTPRGPVWGWSSGKMRQASRCLQCANMSACLERECVYVCACVHMWFLAISRMLVCMAETLSRPISMCHCHGQYPCVTVHTLASIHVRMHVYTHTHAFRRKQAHAHMLGSMLPGIERSVTVALWIPHTR